MATKSGKILVVDDNAGIRSALKILLPLHFETVETIASPSLLTTTIEKMRPDVVLLDMNFKTSTNTGNEGLYWTSELKRFAPDIEVVLFTAYADIQLAVEGMKRGAFDFVVKPWENDKLIAVLTAARNKAQKSSSKSKNATLSIANHSQMIWGKSTEMLSIKSMLSKIAPTDATVLITGENGTGKDVLAHEIHAASLRKNRNLIAVDAGAITETLFESELFGHVKGAFTDAHTDHEGKFEQANGGTLFLDEIGNIPLHLQAKLLRAIQNRSIVRVGGTQPIAVDIRLICATNMDLEQLVNEGRFREDLYYRINTVHIHLPPLRNRKDDIEELSQIFLEKYAQKYHRNLATIDPSALDALSAHNWSGNIRELQNVIEKSVILSEGDTLTAADIQIERSKNSSIRQSSDLDELQTIRNAMQSCNNNISAAAKMLGVSRPTLYAKLKKFGL